MELALDTEVARQEVNHDADVLELLLVDAAVRALVDLDADGDGVDVAGVIGREIGQVGSADPRAVGVNDQMGARVARVEGPHSGDSLVAPKVGADAWDNFLRGSNFAPWDALRGMQDDATYPCGRPFLPVVAFEPETGVVFEVLDDLAGDFVGFLFDDEA